MKRNQHRRYQISVPPDLIGIVRGALFTHAVCFESKAELASAISFGYCVVVLDSDEWKNDVGLCVKCHRGPEDEP